MLICGIFERLALAAEREALSYQPIAVLLTDTSALTRSWQQNHSAPWLRDTHLVDKLSYTADEVSTQKQSVAAVLGGSLRNAALSCVSIDDGRILPCWINCPSISH